MAPSKEHTNIKTRLYFEYIEELKKHASRAPRREYSKLYKEVADILSEAYDEYEPTELPKYQARLQNFIKLAKDEGLLDDEDFNSRIFKAKEFLDNKVKERFGAFKKIAHLGEQSARVLGSVSAYVSDFLAITDRAADAGRRLGNVHFGSRGRVDNEEHRRQYDTIKGVSGQYGDAKSSSSQLSLPGPQALLGLPDPNQGNVTQVKDETLIGTNNQQNKVLIQLISVNKDTNQDIKQIKKLLVYDAQASDLEQDRSSLSDIESRNERISGVAGGSIKGDAGILSSLFGSKGGSQTQPNQPPTEGSSATADILTAYLGWKILPKVPAALSTAVKFLGRALPFIAAGKSVLDSYDAIVNNDKNAKDYGTSKSSAGLTDALYASTFGLGDLIVGDRKGTAEAIENIGNKVQEKVTLPIKHGGQSISAKIGEAVKGVDYYKKLFSDPSLLQGDQDKAEEWALQYLEEAARQKQALLDEAFANGNVYGNGSYQIDGVPQSIDEARLDVQTAKEKARDYAEYIQEKKKKGGGKGMGLGSGPNARFRSNGKLYTNPLYSDDHSRKLEIRHRNTVNTQAALREEAAAEAGLEIKGLQTDPATKQFEIVSSEPKKNTQTPSEASSVKTMGSDMTEIPDEVELIKRAITAAETGAVTDKNPLDSPDRYIRTTGGANSSAWGPQQITMSLAKGGLKNNLFAGDPALQKWVQEKFIPQGKKFLNSSYSDPTYGSGGKGDLTSAEDRQMYDKMSSILIGDAYKNNKGDVLSTLGEWRFGTNEKNTLMSRDSRYAQKAQTQLASDINQAQKLELAATSQKPIQDTMARLSKEQEDAKSQPVIVPVSSGGANPSNPQPSVSTKSMGASPNAVSETSMLLALRQSIASLFG